MAELPTGFTNPNVVIPTDGQAAQEAPPGVNIPGAVLDTPGPARGTTPLPASWIPVETVILFAEAYQKNPEAVHTLMRAILGK